MDKTAVVYYSLDGHTHLVATKISERLDCPAIRLRLQKEFSNANTFPKYFRAGKSSVFRDKPALVTSNLDLEAYDTFVIATPVWAGNLSSPVRSFLSSHSFDGKQVFLVATNNGGSFKRCFATMRKLLPTASVAGEICFVKITEENYPSHRRRLEEFCENILAKQ
ncbi:MAG: flavodoxin family protein [Sphaerochaeta sp.]|uniref:flavodoxin family protein n=1 Tax=Sphaerochaeta sp. TaxID=1972642 RepID=UPI003D0CC39C